MKKALLLAYYFPPRTATGSLRATYLAKYLPAFGWQVTVVTARFSAGQPPPWATVSETGYTDIIERTKKLFGVPKEISTHEALGISPPKVCSKASVKQRLVATAYDFFTFPDPQIGWFNHGVRAVLSLLHSGDYDAIISTSYPYSSHLIARRALFGKNLPWLADLRDAWRGNHYISRGLRSALDAVLEYSILKRANAITTVSAPLARLISNNNPNIHTFDIPNAFDPDDWVGIPFACPHKFTITYAGSLLQGFRDPEPLFDALLDHFQLGEIPREKVEVNFYAEKESWLQDAIVRRNLADVVQLKGYVDRGEVLKAERASTANLLILRDHPDEAGVYTGKFFEYIGAGRPILVIGGPERSVVKDLVLRAGGYYASTGEEMRAALASLYEAYTTGADLRFNSEASLEFSASAMAKRFSEVLNEISTSVKIK